MAERFCSEEQVVMLHHCLRADRRELQKIVDAVAKIRQHSAELQN